MDKPDTGVHQDIESDPAEYPQVKCFIPPRKMVPKCIPCKFKIYNIFSHILKDNNLISMN